MTTMKDVVSGYAGVKLTPSEWLAALRGDAAILRTQGRHPEARLLDLLARQYADRLIGAGC